MKMQDDGTSISDVRDQASGAISGLSASGGRRGPSPPAPAPAPAEAAAPPPPAVEAAAPPIPPPGADASPPAQ